MGCIECGFTNSHDVDCKLRDPEPATDEAGNELSSRDDVPAPIAVAPSLTPSVEEALRAFGEAESMRVKILEQQQQLQIFYDQAYNAAHDARTALLAAMKLRDLGLDV
jgi:hypothetical protein